MLQKELDYSCMSLPEAAAQQPIAGPQVGFYRRAGQKVLLRRQGVKILSTSTLRRTIHGAYSECRQAVGLSLDTSIRVAVSRMRT